MLVAHCALAAAAAHPEPHVHGGAELFGRSGEEEMSGDKFFLTHSRMSGRNIRHNKIIRIHRGRPQMAVA